MSYILLAFKKNNILKAPWLLVGRKTAAGMVHQGIQR